MKQLTLIRHAKSDHHGAAGRDFDRPLSLRGLRDAPLVGKHLHKAFAFAPDAILVSPAKRTVSTAQLILHETAAAKVGGLPDARIYEASGGQLVELLHELPEHVRHAALIGHNPGLEELANWLCGRGTITGLRTGGVVMISVPDSWHSLQAGCGLLLTYFHPAMIGGGKEVHGI